MSHCVSSDNQCTDDLTYVNLKSHTDSCQLLFTEVTDKGLVSQLYIKMSLGRLRFSYSLTSTALCVEGLTAALWLLNAGEMPC